MAAHRPEGLRGVTALAPALGDTGGSRFLLALLPVLSSVVPRLPTNSKLDLSRLTRDPEMPRAYLADPHCDGMDECAGARREVKVESQQGHPIAAC